MKNKKRTASLTSTPLLFFIIFSNSEMYYFVLLLLLKIVFIRLRHTVCIKFIHCNFYASCTDIAQFIHSSVEGHFCQVLGYQE